MSLYRPLNEDMLEEPKNRVSYKTYMRNGAAIGAGAQGIGGALGAGNPVAGAAGGAIGGAIQGAIIGAGTAFARNHSKKIDNFARGRKKKSLLQKLKKRF